MTSLLRDERRYVKRWADGTWGSARCKFCCGGIACIFWHASPPFLSVRHAYIRFLGYMIHTWSSLATCVRSRSRKGAGGAQLNQFPSWLLANCSHTKTRAFFLASRRWGAGPTGWPERKRGLYGVKLRGSVMLLLISLIECYSLCSQSVSLIGQISKKKEKKEWEICLNTG